MSEVVNHRIVTLMDHGSIVIRQPATGKMPRNRADILKPERCNIVIIKVDHAEVPPIHRPQVRQRQGEVVGCADEVVIYVNGPAIRQRQTVVSVTSTATPASTTSVSVR